MRECFWCIYASHGHKDTAQTRLNTCVFGNFWLPYCVFNLGLCARADYITALQPRHWRICHPSSFLWQWQEWVEGSGSVALGHPPAPVPQLCLFSLPPSFLWTCFYCCLFFSFVYLVTGAWDSGGARGEICAAVLSEITFFPPSCYHYRSFNWRFKVFFKKKICVYKVRIRKWLHFQHKKPPVSLMC